MNIPSLNVNAAASLAGIDRAASTQSAKASDGSSHSSPATTGVVEKTERVIKPDPAGDSDADGRQTLDTFERRRRDENDDADATAAGPDEGATIASGSQTGDQSLGSGHLDLQA